MLSMLPGQGQGQAQEYDCTVRSGNGVCIAGTHSKEVPTPPEHAGKSGSSEADTHTLCRKCITAPHCTSLRLTPLWGAHLACKSLALASACLCLQVQNAVKDVSTDIQPDYLFTLQKCRESSQAATGAESLAWDFAARVLEKANTPGDRAVANYLIQGGLAVFGRRCLVRAAINWACT